MSSLLVDITEAIETRRNDNDEIAAVVMSFATALDVSTELYNLGMSSSSPTILVNPNLFGVPVLIEEAVPFGEFVIASRPSLAYGWAQHIVDFLGDGQVHTFEGPAMTSDSYVPWKDV